MTTLSDRLPDGHILLDGPVTLPPVLDLLIVGGGPVGTACAFRAKEIGLAALVIDMDDLMKRIRDYAKEKPILPDFGGGDTMEFPAGSDLVNALRFDAIDKDRMVQLWKSLYRKYSVPAQVGVELLQIDRQPDGVWQATARNHFTKENQTILTRNIVLGLGRGVPRRLDIPGNVQDLPVLLVDARQYVGAPACVVGGGTSAAEAVIAISNAKVKSGADETPVYWSYRGQAMPKVSQALAPSLFDVMMSNGNLRFILGSDPVAVTTRDGTEFLSVRTAVSEFPGLPREVVQLEFPKSACVACIGADRPDPLLKILGVDLVPKETAKGDRLLVSPLLETRQPGLFVAGDLLSPEDPETTEFDAHPSTFKLQKRRGNIKAAMRDGVVLAEIVRQRIDGKQEIRVVISPAPAPAPAAKPAPAAAPGAVAAKPAAAAKPAPAAAPPAPARPPSPGRLVALLADGTPADEFPLVADGLTTIGREGATVAFPQDSLLSERHAGISHGPAGLELRDLGSQHGVFLKIPEGRTVSLASGSIVKAGRQWLVAQSSGDGGLVVHYDASGNEIARHTIAEGKTLVLGRTAPSTLLSAEDNTLSRKHLSFSLEGGELKLRDLGSRNGTFVKVDRRWTLEDGDLIWLGNQLLRLVVGDGRIAAPAVVQGKVAPPTAPAPPPAPASPAAAVAASSGAAAAPTSGEPSVTFGPGKTFPFGKSESLLDLALAKRVRIKYDCKVGDCGMCRVEITSGAEHVDPKSPLEEKALRMIGHEEPESRLACLVTAVKGPIVVQVPK